MGLINDRIAQCLAKSELTKTAFAERLGLSRPFVSQLCSGAKVPSDRTISDIVRVFNVNETWLRTGEGEMFNRLTREEELAAFMGDVLREEEPGFRRRFIFALSRLNESELEAVAHFAEALVAEGRGDKKD